MEDNLGDPIKMNIEYYQSKESRQKIKIQDSFLNTQNFDYFYQNPGLQNFGEINYQNNDIAQGFV